MIKLDKRLSAAADLLLNYGDVPTSVCDVGTDHGYICVYLVQNGVKRAIATDISAPSAEKARVNAERYGLSACIDVRVGNGLETVADYEADAAVIAGMGGLMIMQIMADAPKGMKKFVLQPMRSEYELREWLCRNGYIITQEVLAEESEKIYSIILAEQGESEEYSDFDFYIGKKLLDKKDELLKKYLSKKLASLNKKIQGQAKSSNEVDTALEEYSRKIGELLDGGDFDD